MSADDCFQLCEWTFRTGCLPVAYRDGYLLSAKNWVAYCTDQARTQEKDYLLPDGRPNCGFYFGRASGLQIHMKQLAFWLWLTQQKKQGLTAGSRDQISRTRVDICSAFLAKVGDLQFRCCEQREDQQYGVLEKHHSDMLLLAKKDINDILGAEDLKTQDPGTTPRARTSASGRCARCRR